METQPVTHQSVIRAIHFLKAFIPNNQPMGTNELGRMFDLNKSTVSRILNILKDEGLLHHDPDTKKYQLGPVVAEMAMALNRAFDTHLIFMAQPFLDELSAATGEGIAVEVMSGNSSILAYQMPTRKTLRVSVNLGERLPVHVSSGAKIIMAFSDAKSVDSLLTGELTAYTANTITDPEVLKANLVEYRRHGVAFDCGELDEDVHTVAAPIFNYQKKPVAAVVVVVPAKRMQSKQLQTKIVEAVKKAAGSISSQFFFEAE